MKGCVKIAVIGPESTGKSTLVQALADHYHAPHVTEYAREYLEGKGRLPYELDDLERIAKGQVQREDDALQANPPILFCDTDLVTLHIWSLDKFDQAIPFVEKHLKSRRADLYLLCKPDLKWEFDPLREDANRRDELYDWNAWVLKSIDAQFIEIVGSNQQRNLNAINAIDAFLANRP